jgi:hypothetical protein
LHEKALREAAESAMHEEGETADAETRELMEKIEELNGEEQN